MPAEGSSTHHPFTHPSMLPILPMAHPKLHIYLGKQQQEPGLVSPPAPSSSRASTRSSGSIGLGLGLASQPEFAGMDHPRLQLPLLRPPSTSSIPPHTPLVGAALGMADSPNSSIITPSSSSITRMSSNSSLMGQMEGITLRSSPALHTTTRMRTSSTNNTSTSTTWQHQQGLTAQVGAVPRLRRSHTTVRILSTSLFPNAEANKMLTI